MTTVLLGGPIVCVSQGTQGWDRPWTGTYQLSSPVSRGPLGGRFPDSVPRQRVGRQVRRGVDTEVAVVPDPYPTPVASAGDPETGTIRDPSGAGTVECFCKVPGRNPFVQAINGKTREVARGLVNVAPARDPTQPRHVLSPTPLRTRLEPTPQKWRGPRDGRGKEGTSDDRTSPGHRNPGLVPLRCGRSQMSRDLSPGHRTGGSRRISGY